MEDIKRIPYADLFMEHKDLHERMDQLNGTKRPEGVAELKRMSIRMKQIEKEIFARHGAFKKEFDKSLADLVGEIEEINKIAHS